jgi:hypothetical protein
LLKATTYDNAILANQIQVVHLQDHMMASTLISMKTMMDIPLMVANMSLASQWQDFGFQVTAKGGCAPGSYGRLFDTANPGSNEQGTR